jgi:hypothetical protein
MDSQCLEHKPEVSSELLRKSIVDEDVKKEASTKLLIYLAKMEFMSS